TGTSSQLLLVLGDYTIVEFSQAGSFIRPAGHFHSWKPRRWLDRKHAIKKMQELCPHRSGH
ncbi:MAG: hypothetical protein ACREBC_12040, partial [Pyrinomonadaceae bacterium]